MTTPVDASEVVSSSVASGGNSSSTRTCTSNNVTSSKTCKASSIEGLTITVEAVGSNSSRRKDFEEGIHYTLHIPRRLAYEWYKSEDNYCKVLNKAVKGLDLNEADHVLQERIRTKIAKQFGSKLDSKKGGIRKRYLDSSMFLDIKNTDRLSASDLSTQVANLEETVKRLEDESKKKDDEMECLRESVDEYRELLKKSAVTVNQGKLYDEVGERQKRRKVHVHVQLHIHVYECTPILWCISWNA